MSTHSICFFNSHRFWGGGEKLHLEYALGLKARNHEVELFCADGAALYNQAKKEGIPVTCVSVGNLSFLNPFKIIRLCTFLKTKKFDAIVFSSSQDLKLAGLAAKLAGIKKIIYLRGLAVPVKNSFINRFYFSRILSHVIANSEETKRVLLLNLAQSLPEEKIKIVYHGIHQESKSSSAFKKLSLTKISADQIILGNAGRLTEQKAQWQLIELAKILKERQIKFVLYIAGEGELKQMLQTKINEYQLQNEVQLLGFVKEMEQFYESLDIFLLSSGWEGFGYVLVEAMIASKPVVAFDISSNPEIVDHGQTGFLVDYKDLNAFAAKVQLLIENPVLRHEMGEKARQRVMNLFLLENSVINFENCLK